MTTDDLIAFLNARLDEDAWWASEASRCRDNHTPTGEHWQWECPEDDQVIRIDPMLSESVECSCETFRVSLRSVEVYPTGWGETPLAHFPIHTAEEVPSAVGGHIARHDPARVLADVAAKRAIIELSSDATGLDMSVDLDRRVGPRDEATEPYLGDVILRTLALPYADHQDYREEWRP